MPVYIALLRGINLGPHKRMEMEKLRRALESLGFSDIRTYIQSGNVVFRSPSRLRTETLSRRIEQMVFEEFGFPAGVVSRTKEELEKTVRDNPFLKPNGVDPKHLHVMFLPEVPAPTVAHELENLTRPPDQARLLGNHIFLYLPNGVAHSSLTNNPLERKFLKGGTLRNWNTVSAVQRIASELA
jgi:uncharacterized protein (DUF1697 family)